MAFFDYREGRLYAEDVPVDKIAERVQTPVYCYSVSALRQNYQSYTDHFKPETSLVCYAVKANSNQAIIRALGKMGAGADVVSEGELRRALLAGIPAGKIVYSGVAKTPHEMRFALQQNIFQFNVESEPELELLNQVAVAEGKQAAVAFRINPDIDARTHEKISTGKASNKFGIPWTRAHEAYARAAELPGIRVQGIDMHIGSQLTQLEPFEQAFRCLAELTIELRSLGHAISVLDIGGGLGIDYADGNPLPPAISNYARLANDILGHLDCRILVEPGRSLVGNTGILISRVIYIKQGEHDRFLIIDAGMNDLLRPSMYDAYHEIIPATLRDGEAENYQVVGPICETGDTFARNRALPPLHGGDLVAIKNAGAYGAVMASSYNTRPLVPEVLVEGDEMTLIRPRPSYDDLIKLDTPDGLTNCPPPGD
ncbi:MAG: diaminopimelate decarboxylase [Lysobacterales bacterium]